MQNENQKPTYRFPKSRSKKLPDALELAKKLSGFTEENGFSVAPTAEEATSEAFGKLLGISEKWKGAGFYIGDSSVSRSEFLDALKSSAEPEAAKEEPAEESSPEPEAPKEEPAEESKPEPEAAKEEPAEESSPEPEAAKEEPAEESSPEPEAAKEEPAKKGRGLCCCAWFPLGGAAMLAIISQFL